MMLFITNMNLALLDLNLLVVLHAVLEERSATKAAKRLNVTQSAVSNALARLRTLLGDPLVVRNGRGLVATPRAEELGPVLAKAISALESAIDRGASFVPEESTRTFTMGAADNHQAREVPLVAAAFARKLPRAKLRIVSADFLASTGGLAGGEVDLAFVPSQLLGPEDLGAPIFEERAAMVVRRDHPRVRGRLTPKLWNALPHIDVEVALGKTGVGHRLAERYWQGLGLVRNVAVTVPSFTTAAMVASKTDCIAGIPGRLAEVLCKVLPITIAKTSFPLPTMEMSITWHARTDADPGARYFRKLVVDAVA